MLCPLLAFCGATIRSGIDAVLDYAAFDILLRGADLCVTGEGCIDGQSCYGKAISGVASRCRAQGVPVEAVGGCVGDGWDAVLRMGIRRVRTLAERIPASVPQGDRLSWSMSHADLLLEAIGRDIALSYGS